jgi:small conductance mechanosensitive channel
MIRGEWRGAFCSVGLSLLLALGSAAGSRAEAPAAAAAPAAEAKKDAPTSQTTADPSIDLGDLKLMLEPMTRPQLDAEVEGWTALLRAKVAEISNAELAVRRKNREIAALKDLKSAAEKSAAASAKAEEKGKPASQSAEAKAAAAKLAEANAKLVQSGEDGKKAATGDPHPVSGPAKEKERAAAAAADKDVLKRVAEKAQQTAQKDGDQPAPMVAEKVAAAAKESAASHEIAQPASQTLTAAAVAPKAQKAETLAAKTDEAAAAKTDVKVQLVDYSTQLVSERTGIIDRLKVVLDEVDLEGGDTKAPRAYIAAVSGLKVEVSDYVSTLARLKSWLTADEGGLRWARNTGLFFAYVIGSILLARIVRSLVKRSMSGAHQTSQLLRNFIVDVSGRGVEALGVLAGLSALEINLAPILAVIGAAGFVVAFALQGTLSNLASGLLIMVNKPFDIGDLVEVGGDIKGRVDGVNIFSTLITTEDNLKKIVPNNTIWSGVIVNHTTGVTAPAHPAGSGAAEATQAS